MPKALKYPSLYSSLTAFRVTSYGIVRSGPWRYHMSTLLNDIIRSWACNSEDHLLGVQGLQGCHKIQAQTLECPSINNRSNGVQETEWAHLWGVIAQLALLSRTAHPLRDLLSRLERTERLDVTE